MNRAPRESEIHGYLVLGKVPSLPFPPSHSASWNKQIGWTTGDEHLRNGHARLFEAQAEKMVDSWRAVIASQPHLAQWFFAPDGKPDEEYKGAVKSRFVRGVVDVATRPRDEAWLDYQEEIGLRHTPEKKK